MLEVNTTADVVDSGDAFLSLREAVLAANASAGDEVIQLPAGHYQLTRQGANEDNALTGDLDIRDHGSLKIIGAGRDDTIIDAGPLMVTKLGYGDRIFHVHGAAFEMTGLTVTGGTQSALFNQGGVVSIAFARFTGNHFPSGTGAIVNAGVEYIDQHGWMSIDNTIIADNSGGTGGIRAFVDTIVTNSHFERNRGDLFGGAMLIGGQTYPHIEIRNSRFVENEAEYGGAIQSLDNAAMLLITNSDFERNRAEAGGAVAIITTRAQITSSRFIGNRATGDGGAILSWGEVLVAGSLIASNSAEGNGGGLFGGGNTVVWNSTISDNQANVYGGGIAGKVQVSGSTIVRNRADADGDGTGTAGGFSTSQLHNSIVVGNLRGAPGADIPNDLDRIVEKHSHNLIGDPASAGGLVHGVAGNIVGDGAGGALDLADVLQPLLAEHGGPTLSYMLAPDSPALDAGDSAIDLAWIMASQYSPILVGYPLPSSDFDQRGPGYAREVGPSIDIGAVEAGATFRGAVDEPRIFYNNSVYDGGSTANPLLDHLALDYRKQALLPNGSLAEAANVTSYARGINGIMLDLAGSRPHVTAADFNFRVGASNDPAGWAIAPAPASVQVLSGLGSRGGDRIVITWPDGAIKNTYLQVIVAANENTGLVEPDTFFFGNRVGDTMQSQPPAFFLTNAADELRLRNAGQFPDYYLLRAHDQFDFDKSGRISAADALIARNHGGALPRIRIAASAAATPLAADALPANTVAANVAAWALRESFDDSHAEPLPPPPDQPVASPLPTLMARVVDRAVLLLESDAFVTLDGSRRPEGTDDSRDDLADIPDRVIR